MTQIGHRLIIKFCNINDKNCHSLLLSKLLLNKQRTRYVHMAIDLLRLWTTLLKNYSTDYT